MANTVITRAANTAAHAQFSPLLNLAAELRNHIYRLALTTQSEIKIDKAAFEHHTSLLRTCKQIRNEALQIFYSENRFHIDADAPTAAAAARWLSTLGNKSSLIRNACILFRPSIVDVMKVLWRFKHDFGHVVRLLITNDNVNELCSTIIEHHYPVLREAMSAAKKIGVPEDAIRISMPEPDMGPEETRRGMQALVEMNREAREHSAGGNEVEGEEDDDVESEGDDENESEDEQGSE